MSAMPSPQEAAKHVVRFGLAPRLPGLTTEEFVRRWTEHGVRTGRAGRPGRLSYVQNVPVLEHGRHLLPYPGFDVCTEATYESMAAVTAAFASGAPVGLHPDRYTLLDESCFCPVIARRKVLVDRVVTEDAVKLLIFYRAHPLRGPNELFDRLTKEHADIVAETAPARHEILLASGAEMRPCDAVEIIWFARSENALNYARSEESYKAAIALGGRAFGTERLIARPISG